MNNSISFDRAVDFYDATRTLPEPVATRGVQAILDLAGPGALMLDVGTGTGRVSVPLLKRNANLIGCDLSFKMMTRLQQKFSSPRLAQADASRLPFPAHRFDAVITCHVMHLVGPWRQALDEYRRILKRGGVYINARTERGQARSVRRQIRDHWQSCIAARGISTQRPGLQNEEELIAELRSMGVEVQEIDVVHFTRSYSVRDVLEGISNRTHSHTWNVPDPIFAICLEELRQWVAKEFPDPSKVYEEESQFVLDVAHFD